MNYYQASVTKSFHLSVGAIVLTKDNKVLTHYWKKKRHFQNLYLLMRETMEENETLEAAVHRGLKEEMGVTCKIITYIGSHVSNDEWFGEIDASTPVEKTTLYFLVRETRRDLRRIANDPETDSEILEMDIDSLVEKMKEQRDRYKNEDLDASKVLRSAKKYLSNLQSTKLDEDT